MAQSPGYDHDIFISYAHNDNYGFGGGPGWVDVFEELGLNCFFFAGEVDHPAERSYRAEEAHFEHPEIKEITKRAFESEVRTARLSDDILWMSMVITMAVLGGIESLVASAIGGVAVFLVRIEAESSSRRMVECVLDAGSCDCSFGSTAELASPPKLQATKQPATTR